ncbi:primosomal protein N', partial [Candidatus Saccharibacteria bacterium]|nr:primosomal protein N' [Candidatus Saccharibacteria bacterium]
MYYEVIPGREAGRIETSLTYASDDSLVPGTIVEIPIGRKKSAGVVIKKVAQPEFECRKITRILYSIPLPNHLVKTAKWMAEYYQAPLSACMGMMLPVGVLKQRRGQKTEQMFGDKLAWVGASLRSGSRPSGPSPRADGVPSRAAALRNPLAEAIAPSAVPLNPHQKNALQGLQQAAGATKLLYGVTGSGKTNVYLELAKNALLAQKSVVLLVPEIALTGQLVQVFREVFDKNVVLIHSKQTEVERQKIFDALLLAGRPKVVVGPRSALFAPLKDLGLIIIDEEHEGTYYQENPPRYSTVRVASVMATTLKCDCILGSATPNVCDYYIAKKKNTMVNIPVKAKDAAVKPEITVVDFKNRDNFSKNRYFSNQLLASIKENLEKGHQTLIFHNRRGSSPLTVCENCGEEILCPNCYLPLTLHADTYELVCHTCGFHEKVPAGCPKCHTPGLIHKGFGTKMLESELRRLFPDANVARFDADSKKGEDLAAVYTEVKNGEVDILVGTQTLAKGLDLPRLATVGVVQADAGLSLPDYAAEERVFQLLTQVIGRVGRGHLDTAKVYIQTFRP